MIPTREQFKDFIASIKRAQEKEDKLEHNVSDIDAFYDYLVKLANLKKEQNQQIRSTT